MAEKFSEHERRVRKAARPSLQDYHQPLREIDWRFRKMPRVQNLRTDVEHKFLENGMDVSKIQYFPDLKRRQEKIHQRYFLNSSSVKL